MRVLILGGSSEASALARLVGRAGRISRRCSRSPAARAARARAHRNRAAAASAASRASSIISRARADRGRDRCDPSVRGADVAQRRAQPARFSRLPRRRAHARRMGDPRRRSLDRGRRRHRGRARARRRNRAASSSPSGACRSRLSRPRRSIITSSASIDAPQGLGALPHHRLILARPPFGVEDEDGPDAREEDRHPRQQEQRRRGELRQDRGCAQARLAGHHDPPAEAAARADAA